MTERLTELQLQTMEATCWGKDVPRLVAEVRELHGSLDKYESAILNLLIVLPANELSVAGSPANLAYHNAAQLVAETTGKVVEIRLSSAAPELSIEELPGMTIADVLPEGLKANTSQAAALGVPARLIGEPTNATYGTAKADSDQFTSRLPSAE